MHSGLGMTKNRYYIKGSCGKYMVLLLCPKWEGRQVMAGRKLKPTAGKKLLVLS